MNILVTGGAGYIGAITAHQLKEAGFDPVIYDSLEKGHRESVKDFELIIGETQDWKFLTNVMREKKIKAVMHFAAYIEMGESMKNPQKYFFNNVVGSLNLFRAMLKASVKQIVFSSTAGIYGEPTRLPIKEEDAKEPNNPYGESKLMVERILSWYDRLYQLRFISLRYFNAAGATLDGKLGEAHQPETHLIPNILQAVREGKEFVLNGDDYNTPDGSCIRDYIHVLDLASAHILALQALQKGHKSDAYNIGAGKGYSSKQVIEMVKKITGKNLKIKVGPRRPGDVDSLIADSSKFIQQFGWQPKYSDLKTIVKTAWNWPNKD